MFTGIVEELGRVRELAGTRLSVGCRSVLPDAGVGASIAVNGVCLTVVERRDDGLAFDLSEETLRRTALRRLRAGDGVNLERPVTLATRLGGHLVQGHVDGVGEVREALPDATGGTWMTVAAPAGIVRYLVEKGSVAVDGVSLTLAAVGEYGFTVALIPHTLAVTTLGAAAPGDPVNLEVDVIAKHVAAYVEGLVEGARR
jgi:riboflavin synthase